MASGLEDITQKNNLIKKQRKDLYRRHDFIFTRPCINIRSPVPRRPLMFAEVVFQSSISSRNSYYSAFQAVESVRRERP